eukprot:13572035-Heterocapsa_arctica.AAC.1
MVQSRETAEPHSVRRQAESSGTGWRKSVVLERPEAWLRATRPRRLWMPGAKSRARECQQLGGQRRLTL